MAGKVKARVKRKEDIPEGLLDFYMQDGDEWSFVGVDGADGDTKVKEFRAENINLRSQNQNLRKNLEELEHRMKSVEGIDPSKYANLLRKVEKLEEDEEKNLIQEGKIDEVVQRRTATAIASSENQVKQVQKTLKEQQEENSILRSKLGALLIDQTARSEIGALGAKFRSAEAEADYLRRARDTWQINENAQMVPLRKDATGKTEIRYGKTGDMLSMKEWAGSQLEDAAHLFESSGGGQATGGKGSTPDRKRVIDIDDPAEFGKNLVEIAKGNVTVQ